MSSVIASMARALPIIRWYYIIPIAILILLSSTQRFLQSYNFDLYSLFEAPGQYTCEQPQYTARIASYSPLIIHLENFITADERERLISLGTPALERSFVFDKMKKEKRVSPKRSSWSAFLRNPDPVIDCVLSRASAFQGHITLDHLETLQVVRYAPGERFALHTDWGMKNPAGFDRTTTFFAYLKADCDQCGTYFPKVELRIEGSGQQHDEWCRLVECDSDKNGTVFRALKGSAVFWRNLDDEDVGDPRVLHAGLPPERGEKVGLNIWTRGG